MDQKTRTEEVLGKEVEVRRERMDNRFLALWLYRDAAQRLLNCRGVDIQLWVMLVMVYLNREDGVIEIYPDRRKELCEMMEIEVPTFYQRMHNLIEKGVVEKVGMNLYKVDPSIISVEKPVKKSRGEWLKEMPMDEKTKIDANDSTDIPG